MNHDCNLIVSLSNIFQSRLEKFGDVGLGTYTLGIKGCHKIRSGSLAKRKLCFGPAGVINCTPLSALSFWVNLLPEVFGYNSDTIFGSDIKESACSAEDLGSIPRLGRSQGMATHSSVLAWRNPMDRGAWWATVHGVAETCLKWLSTA